jgi:quercetin dioxygenase-like cupin family protein
MTMPEFAEFEATARAQGFDEVVERRWAPNTVLETHTHPFAVKARVVEGEMWLTVAGQTRHLVAGDEFVVDRDAPHAERYGADGAVYWVARRNFAV